MDQAPGGGIDVGAGGVVAVLFENIRAHLNAELRQERALSDRRVSRYAGVRKGRAKRLKIHVRCQIGRARRRGYGNRLMGTDRLKRVAEAGLDMTVVDDQSRAAGRRDKRADVARHAAARRRQFPDVALPGRLRPAA